MLFIFLVLPHSSICSIFGILELLHQIFECLYQADVITYEGFEQWEQSKDPAEQEGKGVAIKSTTQFFTWLREVDPDEET